MKRTKFILICLAFVLLAGVVSSCTSSGKPEDAKTTTEVVSPDPVDLSLLSEEEVGKISEDLLEILKATDKTAVTYVSISLAESEDEKNIDTLINEKMSQKSDRMDEIKEELNALREEQSSLTGKTDSASKGRMDEITHKISALEEERSTFRMGYNELRIYMLKNIYTPIVTDFAERHGIDLSANEQESFLSPRLYGAALTPEKIIEVVKDDMVVYVGHVSPPGSAVEWDEESTSSD